MSTYQVFAAPIYDTTGHMQSWAQSFGGAFTTFGWSAQSGHGEIVATGTGATYAWTNPVLPTTALLVPNSYTFKGAFVPSTTYVGGNSAGLSTECDVVTSAGITYVHITATSSLSTAPASDTTNWQPLQFEIWKSNGTNTTSLPIYIKIIYTVLTTGQTGPGTIITIGTGIDSNGNLTNTISLGGTPNFIFEIAAQSTGSSLSGQNSFSGDADNIRWILNQGAPTTTTSIQFLSILVVDRAVTSSGTYTDAFFYVGMIASKNAAQVCISSIMLNSAIGGQVGTVNVTPWIGATTAGGSTNSTALFGSAPVFPIFPVVGYVANPILGAVGVHHPDYANADGSIIPVWTYGATHTYLVSSQLTAQAASIDNGTANGGINVAILFE